MSPQRSYLILSAYVPDVKFNILICDCLHVEPDGRDSCDVLVEFQFVEDC